MIKKSFLLILTSVLCIQIAAAPKRPDWVDSIPVALHLYQGMGVADDTGSAEEDRLRADQNARSEIIQEISSTISSEVALYYQESIGSQGVQSAESVEVFTSLSSAYADATIEGIRIVDRYYDKKRKTHYTYATLSRADFQEQMKRKADAAIQYTQERFKLAHQALDGDDVRSALNELSGALSHVLTAQSLVKKHLRGDLDQDGKTEYLDARLGQAMTSILKEIRFIQLEGDQQKGERDQALKAPLKGQLIYTRGDLEIPITNAALAVSIEGAEADFARVVTTNSEGEFSVTIDNVISASRPNPSIGINLHFPQMAMYYATTGVNLQEIISSGLNFTFNMDVAASVKIFVRVLEEINGERLTKSKSDGLLIKALIGKKYKVIDAMRISRSISIEDLDFSLYYEEYESLAETLLPFANYAIIGVISSETSSTGTINYAQAYAKLNVVDLSTGRILSSGNTTGAKTSGNTEDKANKSALRKCSYAAISDVMRGLQSALK